MSWKSPPPKTRRGRGDTVANNGVYVRVIPQGKDRQSVYTSIGAGAAHFLGLVAEVEHVGFLFGEDDDAGKIALHRDADGETARRQPSGSYLILSRSAAIINAIGIDAAPQNVSAERDVANKLLIFDAPARPVAGAAKVACKVLEDTPEASGTAREAPSVALSGATPRIEDRASPSPVMGGGMAERASPIASPSFAPPSRLIDLRAAPSSMEARAGGRR